MEKKRSIIGMTIGVAFIFFGLLSLINYLSVRPVWASYGRSTLAWNILAVIYIIIGFILFSKWNIFRYWQKGAFVGMLVRLILLGLIGSYFLLKIGADIPTYIPRWDSYILNSMHILSSPFHMLHSKFIISPRAVESGMHVFKNWEMFISSILDTIYACIVGAIVARLIKKKKSSPAPK